MGTRINQFKPVQQNRRQAVRAFCPNIYTVFGFELACLAALMTPIKSFINLPMKYGIRTSGGFLYIFFWTEDDYVFSTILFSSTKFVLDQISKNFCLLQRAETRDFDILK